MLEQSLFFNWVVRYYPGIVLDVINTLNGNTPGSAANATYLHKTMLTPEYSLAGRWESLNTPFTNVMADIVAMDSSLPLKKRDSIGKTNGQIPKMGLEMSLNEQQLTDISNLAAINRPEAQLVALAFNDVKKVITAIYEKNEYLFLQAFSSGVCLADDLDNVGAGIRVDYGFYAQNKFGTSASWADPNAAKPIDDLTRIKQRAAIEGNSISHMWMDRPAFNQIVNSAQVKQSYAFSAGFVGGNIPTPDLTKLTQTLQSALDITPHIVERVMRSERDGAQATRTPWAPGQITFTDNMDNVGSLAWSDLAESRFPTAGVAYQYPESYIMVKKHSTSRPSKAEWTSAEARVIPVITNVNRIYQLDSTAIQA